MNTINQSTAKPYAYLKWYTVQLCGHNKSFAESLRDVIIIVGRESEGFRNNSLRCHK